MQDQKHYLVQACDGGYRVVWLEFHSDESTPDMIPVNDKVYFHATSAYAAVGRLTQQELVQIIGFSSDPAKKVKAQ